MELFSGMAYKYIDIVGAKESLLNRTLRLRKASKTNDPFECHPCLIEIHDIHHFIQSAISIKYPKLSFSERKKLALKMHINYTNYGIETVYESVRELFSFVSLSKYCNIHLMWSYYASQHKGICIGYKLEPSPLSNGVKQLYPLLVKYPNRIEKILVKRGKTDHLLPWITTKSIDWCHEHEVRLTLFNQDLQKEYEDIVIPKIMVRKIVFGLRTDQTDINDIKAIVSSNYPNQNIEYSKIAIDTELFKIKEVPYI